MSLEIFENRKEWYATYQAGWLAHLQETGQCDWKLYTRPHNRTPIVSPGIDLRQSRLVLISTAGAYLVESQTPFDAENLLGDYSIRTFPSDTSFGALSFDHTHYDHTAVEVDPQVLLPLRHLEDMVREGFIGELAERTISYMGYQPDATRTVDETIPAVIDAALNLGADAALLIPA
ncbi:MAG: hypothetical protein J5I90_13695 [Caldilineales bacterium]|nr:hypothetical protein [Caldilineales bacterium]